MNLLLIIIINILSIHTVLSLNFVIKRINVLNSNNNYNNYHQQQCNNNNYNNYYYNINYINNNNNNNNKLIKKSNIFMNSNSITDATYTPIINTNNNGTVDNDDDNKSLIEKILKRSSDYINRTRLIGMYGLSLNLRPISTKSLSSAIGFILGDFIAQMITRNFKYDLIRSIRIGAFGALIHGPCGHLFFSLLEKKLPGGGVGVVTLKVIIDQLIWSPLFATLLISFLGITSGCAPYQIYKIISASLKPLVLLSWMIWPLAHFFNFRIVPTKHRLLYSNIIQLIYNVIACYIVTK